MLAYQVWECTRSTPDAAAVISRSTDSVPSAAFAAAGPGAGLVPEGTLAIGAERMHVDVDEPAELADQILDVDAGPP